MKKTQAQVYSGLRRVLFVFFKKNIYNEDSQLLAGSIIVPLLNLLMLQALINSSGNNVIVWSSLWAQEPYVENLPKRDILFLQQKIHLINIIVEPRSCGRVQSNS